MPAYDINLRDYWRIIRKKRAIVISTVVMMGLFSFLFAYFLKPIPQYEATASVKIEKVSTMAGLILQVVSYTEGDNLETQAKVVVSYPIIELVAKRLGIIDKTIPSEKVRENDVLLQKVLGLKSRVDAAVDGFTNIIDITANTSHPKFSQRLANTVAEVYRVENIKERNQRAIKARKFIEAQLKIIGNQLAKSEEDLRTFKEKNTLVSFDTQQNTAFRGLVDLESQYDRVSRLINELIKLKEHLTTYKGLSKEPLPGLIYGKFSPLFLTLHQKLVDIDIKRNNLLEIYTETHPDVTMLNNEIKSITEAMLKEITSQINTLRKQQEMLHENIETIRGRFESLPEAGLLLARLERNVTLNVELYTLLQSKHQESLIQEAEKVEEVTIIKPAIQPGGPMNPPKTSLTGFIGLLMGAILGIVFAFISETLDTSIGTIEDVEDYLSVPVIGIIPHIGMEEIQDIIAEKSHGERDIKALERNARLVSHFAPKSPIAESFRSLRTNIQFMGMEKGLKSLLFTSATHGEGKTITSLNLALTMAQMGHKTLIVDCDLRRPSIYKVFGIDKEPGLTDIILGNCDVQEALRTVTDIMVGQMGMEEIMMTPGIDNLNIINAGTKVSHPAELLSSTKMAELITQFEKDFDIVFFDTPPVLPATDAAILGSKTGGVIFVYQVGKIARGALRQAKVRMENVNAQVFGIVLNGLTAKISPGLYGKRYYEYYSYAEEEELLEKPSFRESPVGFFKGLYQKISEKIKREKTAPVPIDEKEKKHKTETEKSLSTTKKTLIIIFSLLFLVGGFFWEKNIHELRPFMSNLQKTIQQKIKILKDQYRNILKF